MNAEIKTKEQAASRRVESKQAKDVGDYHGDSNDESEVGKRNATKQTARAQRERDIISKKKRHLQQPMPEQLTSSSSSRSESEKSGSEANADFRSRFNETNARARGHLRAYDSGCESDDPCLRHNDGYDEYDDEVLEFNEAYDLRQEQERARARDNSDDEADNNKLNKRAYDRKRYNADARQDIHEATYNADARQDIHEATYDADARQDIHEATYDADARHDIHVTTYRSVIHEYKFTQEEQPEFQSKFYSRSELKKMEVGPMTPPNGGLWDQDDYADDSALHPDAKSHWNPEGEHIPELKTPLKDRVAAARTHLYDWKYCAVHGEVCLDIIPPVFELQPDGTAILVNSETVDPKLYSVSELLTQLPKFFKCLRHTEAKKEKQNDDSEQEEESESDDSKNPDLKPRKPHNWPPEQKKMYDVSSMFPPDDGKHLKGLILHPYGCIKRLSKVNINIP